MEMTPERWAATERYAAEVFGEEDVVLQGISAAAAAAGLPDIAVSAEEGRLLMILTSMTPGRHADVAEAAFRAAGLADRVELRRGAALDLLPSLAAELGPASVDVAFIDAHKIEYPDYFRLLEPLIAPGGLFLADNVYGTGGGWIDQAGSNPDMAAIDRFNRLVAGHPDFEAVAVPIRTGLLIARRRE
jgi:predicted O-methyltransferase YrrM